MTTINDAWIEAGSTKPPKTQQDGAKEYRATGVLTTGSPYTSPWTAACSIRTYDDLGGQINSGVYVLSPNGTIISLHQPGVAFFKKGSYSIESRDAQTDFECKYSDIPTTISPAPADSASTESECCDRHEQEITNLKSSITALQNSNKKLIARLNNLERKNMKSGIISRNEFEKLKALVHHLESKELVLEDFDFTPIIRQALGL